MKEGMEKEDGRSGLTENERRRAMEKDEGRSGTGGDIGVGKQTYSREGERKRRRKEEAKEKQSHRKKFKTWTIIHFFE